MVEKIRSKRKIKTRFGGPKFEIEKLKSLPNESVMQAYAMNYLEPLGQGSSRIAFVLSSKKVLKIARNEKGISQNKAEIEVYTDPATADTAAKIYDFDDQGRWITSDLVKPLTDPSEFMKLTGVSWEEFVQDLTSSVSKFAREKGMTLNKRAHEFTQKAYNMAEKGKSKLKLGDLTVLDHWGKTPNGRVVILDYGFTEDVEAKHYSKNKQPNSVKNFASTADAPTAQQEQKMILPK